MRRFNRESSRIMIENLVREQQVQDKRVKELANKFKKQAKPITKRRQKVKFESECEYSSEYEFCESRLKFKK